jgi:hypothetical protein
MRKIIYIFILFFTFSNYVFAEENKEFAGGYFINRFEGWNSDRQPPKHFVYKNTIYDFETASRIQFNEIAFLEIGNSLLKIYSDGNVEAYGYMGLDWWNKVLKTFERKEHRILNICATRGNKFTIIYYNNELIQIENETGKVMQYKAFDIEASSYKQVVVFNNGYILFSTLNDMLDEQAEKPERMKFRVYNENLEYIEYDAKKDIPADVFSYAWSFCITKQIPIINNGKPGIVFFYYTYQNSKRAYKCEYLFDFKNLRVLYTKPTAFSAMNFAFRKENAENIYPLDYPLIGIYDYIQHRFWFSSEEARYAPFTYPIYNPDLFLKANESVLHKETRSNKKPERKPENGTFWIKESYKSSYTTFHYDYQLKNIVQHSDATDYDLDNWNRPKSFDRKHPGIELTDEYAKCVLKTTIQASAYLTEGNTKYTPDNMQTFSNKPWAIAEEQLESAIITIESKEKPMNWLVIGNGFYHKDRPDLYEKNNRPKEIQIIYENKAGGEFIEEIEGITHRVILEDTNKLQFIPLLSAISKKITIKILSVYEGTDYKDTCINYIGALERYWETLADQK